MGKVKYISSSGILTFVHQQINLKQHDEGKIVFVGISDMVYSVFELAGFHHLFEFFDDVQSAKGIF
jgi:anti-anti-sigma factor